MSQIPMTTSQNEHLVFPHRCADRKVRFGKRRWPAMKLESGSLYSFPGAVPLSLVEGGKIIESPTLTLVIALTVSTPTENHLAKFGDGVEILTEASVAPTHLKLLQRKNYCILPSWQIRTYIVVLSFCLKGSWFYAFHYLGKYHIINQGH